MNKEIYDRNMIVKASNDFAQLARIRVIESEEYWICLFDKCKVSVGRTKNEFENYLIALFNQKGF